MVIGYDTAMQVLPTFYQPTQLANQLGVGRRTIHSLFDSGEFTGFRFKSRADRRIDRRSVVRWLRRQGVPEAEIPQSLICDLRTFGLSPSQIAKLAELLNGDDFRIDAVHFPSVVLANLGQVPLEDVQGVLGTTAYSLAIAPDDGVSKAIQESGFTRILPPPPRWTAVATILRSLL